MSAFGLTVLVLDPHPIFRAGLVTCLTSLPGVERVYEAATLTELLAGAGLPDCDVALVDHDEQAGRDALRRLRDITSTRLVVCSWRRDEDDMLAAIQAGAVGYLCKESLTPEALAGAVHATASGGGVIAPELLGDLLSGIARASRDVLEPRGLSLARLTTREQQVLKLVAEGRSTREVAQELSYGERTVKNILHDVGTKLNARTRSQAVAFAVRERLI
jgi:DNA-binding NarL/FixJ family response regulator